MKDPYSVLGIPSDSDDKQIKEAYRRLARKLHPDVNPGNPTAEEKFKDVQGAYDLLSDPKKRETWDRFGAAAFESGSPGNGGTPFGGRQGFGFPSFDEIFGGGNPLADILSGVFGAGGASRASRTVPPRELRASVEVTFDQAYRGGEIEVAYRRDVACDVCAASGRKTARSSTPCTTCHGSGRRRTGRGAVAVTSQCLRCGGTGKAAGEPCAACSGQGVRPSADKVRVRIPAGVEDGATLRVAGRGNQTRAGKGDLYLTVRVAPDARFERRGADIHLELPVTLAEAALGAELPVPTPDGETRVRIPPGTPSGRKVRLARRGFPRASEERGDLFASIRIVPSPDPSPEERTLLERLAQVSRFNPRS